jgi:hypothetical protein
MRRYKFYLLSAVILSIHFYGFSQEKLNIRFAKLTPQDFDVKPPVTDSAANAIVVADIGNSEFVANTYELSVSLEFSRKTRIKIVNKNGFNAATIEIPLYSSGNSSEKLEGLKAYTYNLESGKVVETKLDNSSVFTEQKTKNWSIKKFTFPALKEGSIIEYTYTIKSDFFFNLQSWSFQGEYPCLWSEYNASIPEFYKYVILSQGYQTFFINKTDQSQVQFTFRAHTELTNRSTGIPSSETFNMPGMKDNHRWVMKDVPGLRVEPFTTTLNNHIAKIEFQLSQIHYPNSVPHFYMNDWKKVADEMKESEKFGALINRANNWLENDLKTIVGDASNEEEKARKIFNYLQDNIARKSDYGVFATTNLKDVLKNKEGSVADINLLLIAMLRHEKIYADPVMLATRNKGVTNDLYPLMDRYNYLIVKAFINNEVLFLDASIPQIAFGKLPLECYNGHARIVENDILTPVYFWADSLKESSTTSCVIINDENKKIAGSINTNESYYSSLKLRNDITKNGIETFRKEITSSMPEEITVSNITVDSLKEKNIPVSVRYDIKFTAFGENDVVYFNPILANVIKKNPFNAAQRFYPVEMPYTSDEVYTLNMEVPAGYVVDEMPKSARIKLNEDEGMFEYLIKKDGDYILMRTRLMINKANFTNEDYEVLRNFYSFVVKKESEQIVFKKQK